MGTTASTVTTNDVVKAKEAVSESDLENDMELSAAEARVELAKELGETDSQIDKDTAFVDKLTAKKETNKFFRDLGQGNLRPSDANRMLEAAMDISETGSIQEIQEAFDKVNSYRSSAGVGQSPLVTNAIVNALSVLDSVLKVEDDEKQELEISSLSKLTNTKGVTIDTLKDAVRTINAYPSYLIDRDDIAKLKESLLSKIASM